ncbi:MAG: hypothetical protein QHH02_01025 [Syntrophomonadaceae bacterium]|nr:hypothetical protein [Syntrophomonadaceae bacterium]
MFAVPAANPGFGFAPSAVCNMAFCVAVLAVICLFFGNAGFSFI